MKIQLKNMPRSPATMCQKCGLFWALQGYNLCPKCADISMGKHHSAKQMILNQYKCYYSGPAGKFYDRSWNMAGQGAEAKTGWSFVKHIWSMGLVLSAVNARSMNELPKIPNKTHMQLVLDAGYTQWHMDCFAAYYGGLEIGTDEPA